MITRLGSIGWFSDKLILWLKILIFLMNALKIEEQCEQIKGVYTEKFLFLGIQCSFRAENSVN